MCEELDYLLEHNMILKKELDRVFGKSYSAEADIDSSFLCFHEPYQAAARVADKDSIILDFGCAYAPQSYYFTNCKQYIGIDLPLPFPSKEVIECHPSLALCEPETRFTTENATFYIMSIQKFLQEVYPTLGLPEDKIIAICSAVPDKEAQRMVINQFPVHYVSYPNRGSDIISVTLPKEKTSPEPEVLQEEYE